MYEVHEADELPETEPFTPCSTFVTKINSRSTREINPVFCTSLKTGDKDKLKSTREINPVFCTSLKTGDKDKLKEHT
ncbi:hypothetical protein Bpfe_007163 [Biomphalaria pfeifferi]|uniref:Uncharacterized protein n=1 Tax=Biomphalaria pfeifferi TaxID=112525 RepID=A0AAD8BZ63_BIOPF|nr:hypothetical protein Bpfe_007163 [Biomphalaria pfeifferi]